MKKLAAIGVLLLGVLAFFQNCSDVNFAEEQGASSDPNAGGQGTGTGGSGDSTGSGVNQPGTQTPGNITPPTGGGTVPGTGGGPTDQVINPPGGVLPPGAAPGSPTVPSAPPGSTFPPGTTTVPPGTVLPRVSITTPVCERLKPCAVIYRLNQAYPMVVDFTWLTNDTGAAAPPPAGYIRGIVNTHYLSNRGPLRFMPGEVEKTVYFQNINPDPALNITVPVLMQNCAYGGVLGSCKVFFNQ